MGEKHENSRQIQRNLQDIAGRALRRHKSRENLTAKQIAKYVGCEAGTVESWLAQDNTIPTLDNFWKLVINVNVDYGNEIAALYGFKIVPLEEGEDTIDVGLRDAHEIIQGMMKKRGIK